MPFRKKGTYNEPGYSGATKRQTGTHVPHHLSGSTAQLNPVPAPGGDGVQQLDLRPVSSSEGRKSTS